VTALNRAVWIVVALFLIAAGVFGILANTGRLSRAPRDYYLAPNDLVEQASAVSPWWMVLALAAGLVLAALGLLLLRAQFARRRPALPDVIDHRTRPGSAEVPGQTSTGNGTVAGAFERDLESDPRIAHATVRLTGEARAPEVAVELGLARDTDLADVADYVQTAMRRLEKTISVPPRLRELAINPAKPGSARPVA